MKKYVWALLLVFALQGCGAGETMETISDEMLLPVMAEPVEVTVSLPGEAALPVSENENGRLYLSEEYEILVQTLSCGDLNATLEKLTGCSADHLTVMETEHNGIRRYEFVWASAGEKGDRVGRGAVLDDGNYHYCLTALWDADEAQKSQINWNQVFSSFGPVSY